MSPYRADYIIIHKMDAMRFEALASTSLPGIVVTPYTIKCLGSVLPRKASTEFTWLSFISYLIKGL